MNTLIKHTKDGHQSVSQCDAICVLSNIEGRQHNLRRKSYAMLQATRSLHSIEKSVKPSSLPDLCTQERIQSVPFAREALSIHTLELSIQQSSNKTRWRQAQN